MQKSRYTEQSLYSALRSIYKRWVAVFLLTESRLPLSLHSQRSTTTMSLWAPPPEPANKLGRHRQLSSRAGVHVSPIQLGAMNIGDQWDKFGMGSMNKESSFKLLDAFYEAGGNFIDTANN